MTEHRQREHVEGCFRCDLSRDETTPKQRSQKRQRPVVVGARITAAESSCLDRLAAMHGYTRSGMVRELIRRAWTEDFR